MKRELVGARVVAVRWGARAWAGLRVARATPSHTRDAKKPTFSCCDPLAMRFLASPNFRRSVYPVGILLRQYTARAGA